MEKKLYEVMLISQRVAEQNIAIQDAINSLNKLIHITPLNFAGDGFTQEAQQHIRELRDVLQDCKIDSYAMQKYITDME